MTLKLCKRGFTLMELLVVMSIIVILGALALPAYNAMQASAKYRDAAQEMSNMLRDARSRAATENRQYQVVFQVTAGLFQLQDGTGTSATADWTAVQRGIRLAELTDCSGTADVTIQFNPDGSSTTGDICILDDSSSPKFKVRVNNSATGQVVVDKL